MRVNKHKSDAYGLVSIYSELLIGYSIVLICQACGYAEISYRECDRFYRKSCGPINLYIACHMLGRPASIEDIFELSGMSREGSSTFAGLASAANEYDLYTLGMNTNSGYLKKLKHLAFLHFKREEETHFVLFDGYKDGHYKIIDGTKISIGKHISYMTERDLKKVWTGNLMLISESPIVNDKSVSLFHVGTVALLVLLNVSGIAYLWRQRRHDNKIVVPPFLLKRKLVVFVLLFCVLPGCKKKEIGPKLYIEETVHDVGLISDASKDEIQYDYRISNIGTETLTINKIKTNCACTSMDYPKELPPGESGIIKVRMRLARKMGPQFSSIYVQSNDFKRPEVVLQLQAQKDMVFDTNSDTMDFETLETGQIATDQFEVYIPEAKYHAMPVIVNDSPRLVICVINRERRYTQWDEPIQIITYEVKLDVNHFVGDYESTIGILYGTEKEEIKVSAIVQGKVAASPESFYFPVLTDTGEEKSFVIEGISLPDIIKEIKASDDSIVILGRTCHNNQMEVKFRLLPNKVDGSFLNETIDIILHDSLQPQLSIRILGNKP